MYITAVQEEGREPSVIDMYSWKGILIIATLPFTMTWFSMLC